MKSTRLRLAGQVFASCVIAAGVGAGFTSSIIMAQNTQQAAEVSEHVKVAQGGYLPNRPKVAMVSAEASGEAIVRNAQTGAPVLRVPLAAAVDDADSGDRLQAVDFSALRDPGQYVLEVPGVGRSHPFTVAPDVYARTYVLAMRSYYGQRCGTDVNMGPDFPEFRYDACHLAPATFHPSSGKSGQIDMTGGWHDAGDYGRYIVNSGITTGTLLWAFELNREKLERVGLSIPESGGKIPDTLAEIKWNIDWMLKMQDADGGVWHKATSARFCGFVMPKDDTSEVLVIGNGREPYKTTGATGDFAAVCAAAGRIYQPYDPDYAAKCLAAAERAWQWLEATPDNHYQRNPEGIQTGGYGDGNADDERLWAAAELFRTTGKPQYNEYFLTHYARFSPTIKSGDPQGWPNVQHLAMYAYALSTTPGTDAEAVARIRRDAIDAADRIATRAATNGYRIPLTREQYIWGSNSVLLNYAMMLLIANRFEANDAYVAAALDCLHYVLGRNTFSTSFVTHVGSKWAMRPHHRPSGADKVDQPWPGFIVGGPNSRNELVRGKPADPKRPPAKAWIDDQGSYTTNETAINWNAPLVFVLAEVLP